jgi:hypothetical protein
VDWLLMLLSATVGLLIGLTVVTWVITPYYQRKRTRAVAQDRDGMDAHYR